MTSAAAPTTSTQTVIPGTAEQAQPSSPGPTAAPSVPPISQADVDAASARALKAEKQLASLQKKMDDGSYIKEHLGKILGLDKQEDPAAAIQRMQAEVTHATTRAAEVEANARRAIVNATALSLAGQHGVRADARDDLSLFLDMSGVEVDFSTGRIADTKILSDRIAGLKTAKPFLFDLPAPAPVASKGPPMPGPMAAAPQAPVSPQANNAPFVLSSMDAFLGPKSQLDAHRARLSKTQTV